MLFPGAPTSCDKEINFEITFAALYFYLHELKKCVAGFLKSYFKLEIFYYIYKYIYFIIYKYINFVLRGVFFSRFVQLKGSFSDQKKNSGEI